MIRLPRVVTPVALSVPVAERVVKAPDPGVVTPILALLIPVAVINTTLVPLDVPPIWPKAFSNQPVPVSPMKVIDGLPAEPGTNAVVAAVLV